MGYGSVFPASDAGFLLATVQQLLGIFINVVLFACILAKFQAPQADIVFSDSCVVADRNRVPHLMIRVSNLRCHTLYNLNVRVSLLQRFVTVEGESYTKVRDLAIQEPPPTMAGVLTLCHVLDSASPLFGLSEAKLAESSQMAIQCTFTALDPVYQAEVCAKTSYSPHQLRFHMRFADLVKVTKSGTPALDFGVFDGLVEWRPLRGDLLMSSQPGPAPDPDALWLAFGCNRAGYGGAGRPGGHPELDGDWPAMPLFSTCSFCQWIALMLAEAGVPFNKCYADLIDKPSWLHEANPEDGSTPVLMLDGVWLPGSAAIKEECTKRFPTVAELYARPARTGGVDVAKLNVKIGAVGVVLAGSGQESALRTRILRNVLGIDAATAADPAGEAVTKLVGMLEAMDGALGDKEYFCGAAPGGVDCMQAPALVFVMEFVELGLVDLGRPFAAVAPGLVTYVERWSQRPSWRAHVWESQDAREYMCLSAMRGVAKKIALVAPDLLPTRWTAGLSSKRRELERRGNRYTAWALSSPQADGGASARSLDAEALSRSDVNLCI